MNIETLQTAAMAAVEGKSFEKARDLFLEALAIQPSDPHLHNQLANVLQLLHDYDGAEQHYRQAIDLDQDIAIFYYNLANCQRKQLHFSAAIENYQKTLELDAQHHNALFNLGTVHAAEQQWQLALVSFEKLLNLRPDHPGALLNAAICWIELEDWENAITALKQLPPTEQHSQLLAHCFFNLGISYHRGKHYQLAQQYYHQCLLHEPHNFAATYNLASLYQRQNEIDLALKYYEQALLISPEDASIPYLIACLSGKNTPDRAPLGYIQQLFDDYAEKFDTELLTALNYQTHYQLKKLLDPTCSSLHVLDLGCGTGLSGQAFKDIAKELVGVDISNRMLLEAEKKNIYDQLFQMPIEQILTLKKTFDLILACDVLMYCGDLMPIFRLVDEVMKPQGYFLFSCEKNFSTHDNFVLTKHGRFQHHPMYIQTLIRERGWKILHFKEACLRKQAGEPVLGLLLAVQKI